MYAGKEYKEEQNFFTKFPVPGPRFEHKFLHSDLQEKIKSNNTEEETQNVRYL